MTRLEIEPQFPEPLVNTLLIRPMCANYLYQIGILENLPL